MAAARPTMMAFATALLVAVAIGVLQDRPATARRRLDAATRPAAKTAEQTSYGGRLTRRRRRRRRRARAAEPGRGTELALAVDLLAACLEAGVPLPAALSAASTVTGAAAAHALQAAATALRRGGQAQAWAACEEDSALAPVVRICRRVGTTGAAAAEDLRRLAGEQRRAHQAQQRRRAQRAAVWVVLPLGLCFLPAFLLLTVVPVVVALLPGLR